MNYIEFDATVMVQNMTRFANPTPTILRHTRLALSRVGDIIITRAQSILIANGSIDTRALFDSIGAKLIANNFLAVGSDLPYAEAVERGRLPGTMPPPGSLLGWMSRKGIPSHLEYVIRMAIATRGIPAKPYMVPAFDESVAEINYTFHLAEERIMASLVYGRV